MKKTLTWVALGVVGALTLAGFAVAPALAQQAEEGAAAREGRASRRAGMHMMGALGLSEEQIEQLRALREAAREEAVGVHDQVRAELQALLPRIKDGSLAQNDLVSAQRRIHDLMGQVGEKRAETLYQTYQLLTPEQRAKLGEAIEERLENGRGFGFGMFGGDGAVGGHGRRGHRNGDGTGPRAQRGECDGSGQQSARPAPADGRGSRGERRAAGQQGTLPVR
ncbi:MAG: Spy/CpxP family protein refolding chaperone [Deltaproteobacteria bacterium]|nr:Spy/CpxP family protein refolding chaperone [Deltaproteobacteria bacterium]